MLFNCGGIVSRYWVFSRLPAFFAMFLENTSTVDKPEHHAELRKAILQTDSMTLKIQAHDPVNYWIMRL